MKQVRVSAKRLPRFGELTAIISCGCGNTELSIDVRIADIGILFRTVCECRKKYSAVMMPDGLVVSDDN
jgi:hypothetical protein